MTSDAELREVAEAAIDLFLEYRDVHGYPDEHQAKALAVLEVWEGLTARADVPDLPAWREAGFTPGQAVSWLHAGVPTPSEAVVWTRIGVHTPAAAEQWLDAGFTPQTAAPWLAVEDITPREAATCAASGVDPDAVSRIRRADPGWAAREPANEIAVPDYGMPL